jgi:hypothetical protein
MMKITRRELFEGVGAFTIAAGISPLRAQTKLNPEAPSLSAAANFEFGR